MGAGKIVFTSPSKKLLKAEVYVEAPYVEDSLVLGLVTTYRWVE